MLAASSAIASERVCTACTAVTVGSADARAGSAAPSVSARFFKLRKPSRMTAVSTSATLAELLKNAELATCSSLLVRAGSRLISRAIAAVVA